MKEETVWYKKPVTEEEAWEDDRIPTGVFHACSPAPEATNRIGKKSNAWFFYRSTTADEDEEDDREEHRGRRDRAYHRAGF